MRRHHLGLLPAGAAMQRENVAVLETYMEVDEPEGGGPVYATLSRHFVAGDNLYMACRSHTCNKVSAHGGATSTPDDHGQADGQRPGATVSNIVR